MVCPPYGGAGMSLGGFWPHRGLGPGRGTRSPGSPSQQGRQHRPVPRGVGGDTHTSSHSHTHTPIHSQLHTHLFSRSQPHTHIPSLMHQWDMLASAWAAQSQSVCLSPTHGHTPPAPIQALRPKPVVCCLDVPYTLAPAPRHAFLVYTLDGHPRTP